MTAPWTSLPLLAIDTETTGADPFSDRIVEAAAVEVRPDGTVTNPWRRIINPGITIPDEAAAIHGITNEIARRDGGDPGIALEMLAEIVWDHVTRYDGLAALTMYNAVFDLPLILAECERHDVNFPCFAQVLDPYLIDRLMDRYRKGKRQLTLVADHYDVELGDAAHGALADATAAGKVMWQIVGRYPQLAEHSLASMWLRQVRGHEADRVRFVDYMRINVDPEFDKAPGWPLPGGFERPKSSTPRSGHLTANGNAADPVLAQAGDPTGSAAAGSPTASDIPMSETQNRRVHALISKARPGQDRHAVMTELAGRTITTAKELTSDDADRIVNTLDKETKATA